MKSVTCVETVTLVHHIRGADSDSYKCYVIENVSWYEKMAVAVSADGAKPVNSIVIRIPAEDLPDVMPEKLDYIVKGVLDAFSVPRDLLGRICFQITSVSDNRRGGLPHVKVSGA